MASVFDHVYYSVYKPEDDSKLFTNYFIVAATKNLNLSDREMENRIFDVGDPEWMTVIQQLRGGKDTGRTPGPFFKKISFDTSKPVFTDDHSSLDVMSEREFLTLTLGAGR